jgi:hypothetical protein
MLISINIVSIRPTKRTKNVNKAKNKALAHIKEIIIKIHTIKNIYTEKNTKKAKKIKDSNKKKCYIYN